MVCVRFLDHVCPITLPLIYDLQPRLAADLGRGLFLPRYSSTSNPMTASPAMQVRNRFHFEFVFIKAVAVKSL